MADINVTLVLSKLNVETFLLIKVVSKMMLIAMTHRKSRERFRCQRGHEISYLRF